MSYPKLSILLLACILSVPVLAYDESTHAALSHRAIDNTRLAHDSSVLADLQVPRFGLAAFPSENVGSALSIADLLVSGAVDEDVLPNSLAVTTHFFDPQFYDSVTGAGRGLQLGTLTFQKSPDWALHLNPEYSYQQARSHFFNALALPAAADREAAFGKMFIALGHVIHHIQDMAQPQHVRNDIHCNAEACKFLSDYLNFDLYRPSLYEAYTGTQVERLLEGEFEPVLWGYQQSYIFGAPRDYWYAASAQSAYAAGMAEFTSDNFVSEGTNFARGDTGEILAHPEYARPGPAFTTINPVVESCLLQGNVGQKTGLCRYLSSTLYDPLRTPANALLERLAGESIFNAQSAEQTGRGIYVVNSAVFEDRYQFLLPRAIALSTGLLDYFFRGRIDLIPENNGQGWRLKNLSQEPLNGILKLFAEYPDGTRSELCCEAVVTAPPQGLSGLLQFDLGSDFPGTLVAVVRGNLGLEGSPSLDSGPVVIGRVFENLSKELDFYYGFWLGPPCSTGTDPNSQFRFWVDGQLIHTQQQTRCDELVSLDASNVPNLVPGSRHTISVDHGFFDPDYPVFRAYVKWRPEAGIEVLGVSSDSWPREAPDADGFYVWDTWHGSPYSNLGNQMMHMEIRVLP